MKIYEVGGAVRDEIMDIECHDVDYAVEADSFSEMQLVLEDMGFRLFTIKPEFYTIRALAPTGSKLGRKNPAVDFVLCRKDGPSQDGRRPDYVESGTILDDLARRDFTINAIAKDMETGAFIDPHGGIEDIKSGVLRFVGNPIDRISEDGLRVLRALRFHITRGMGYDIDTWEAVSSPLAVAMVRKVSTERIREELKKMFEHDTIASLRALNSLQTQLQEAIFRDGLWLEPTLKMR